MLSANVLSVVLAVDREPSVLANYAGQTSRISPASQFEAWQNKLAWRGVGEDFWYLALASTPPVEGENPATRIMQPL